MILPDVNLLLHAYNSWSPVHPAARAWWEDLLNGTESVGLPWAALLGFIRIATHRHIPTRPMPVVIACGHACAFRGFAGLIRWLAELRVRKAASAPTANACLATWLRQRLQTAE